MARRAEVLDDLLIRRLIDLRLAAEKHVWHVNRQENKTGEYVDRLSDSTKSTVFFSPHYSFVEHSTREVPDKPYEEFSFNDLDIDNIPFDEADEKLTDLSEEGYEDNQQE